MKIEDFMSSFIEKISKELLEFKVYITSSESMLDKEITYDSWEELYLKWASYKKDKEMPKIRLNQD